MSRVRCPHCGEPLAVQWEVYMWWDVGWEDDQPILRQPDPLEFEGGECHHCGEWVEPSDVVRGSGEGDTP